MSAKEPCSLVVIHYHLLAGGVRSALRLSLTALSKQGWFAGRSLRLLVGRKDGVEKFVRSLRGEDLQIEVKVDPRLDYTDRLWPDSTSFWSEASSLADWLLGEARGATLYWAHNPTLGKNPLLTAGLLTAVREVARNAAPHRFLYHIHDFAECGRLQNILRLRGCWVSGGMQEFYPTWHGVGYAVLNSAAARRLAEVGVPRERIFHLPNAVPPVTATRKQTRENIAPLIQSYAHNRGYRFSPRRLWWTLPIRLIRRKNVLEALLLAAIADGQPQLLVTLDANSEPERPYAETVKGLIKRQKHEAVVGFGHELVGSAFDFDDLLQASDAVVSTSIMEGFGFAFLEGPLRGKPLEGRNLADITEDFLDAGFPATSLYDRFLVPVERERREKLRERGHKFARHCQALLGLQPLRMDAFIAEVDEIFRQETVDFGSLDLHEQLALAGLLREVPFVQELRTLNPGAAEPATFPVDFPERIQDRFGMEPHAQRLAAAFEALFNQPCQQEGPGAMSSELLNLYFSPRYLRPLMGDW